MKLRLALAALLALYELGLASGKGAPDRFAPEGGKALARFA